MTRDGDRGGAEYNLDFRVFSLIGFTARSHALSLQAALRKTGRALPAAAAACSPRPSSSDFAESAAPPPSLPTPCWLGFGSSLSLLQRNIAVKTREWISPLFNCPSRKHVTRVFVCCAEGRRKKGNKEGENHVLSLRECNVALLLNSQTRNNEGFYEKCQDERKS